MDKSKAFNSLVDYTIISPVFNESESIDAFHSTLAEVLDLLDYTFEILMIDDGSTDGSFDRITACSKRDIRVRGISFSRNFGKEAAISAGIEQARGDAVIIIDSDLQHPPAVIPELISQHKLGYEIVYAIRVDAEQVGFVKRMTSRLFYRVVNYLGDVYIEPNATDFRLMGNKALVTYRQFVEKTRFGRGLINWMGFKQSAISFKVEPRFAGETKYSFGKLVLLALSGITAFSSKPLRISFFLGLVFVFLAMVYSIYAVVVFMLGISAPGWPSILISILLIGGVQLLSIGVLGEYIARVFDEVKNRPLYIVDQSVEGVAEENNTSVLSGRKND